MLGFEGFIRSLPLYFLTLKPRKSKPSSICVIMVFSSDNSRPLILRNPSIKGLTQVSSSSGEQLVIMKLFLPGESLRWLN
jgi:hypothetical protein